MAATLTNVEPAELAEEDAHIAIATDVCVFLPWRAPVLGIAGSEEQAVILEGARNVAWSSSSSRASMRVYMGA